MPKHRSKWRVSTLEVSVTLLLALAGVGLEKPSVVPRFIVSWQLWSHGVLSRLDRRVPRAERTVVVEVDDDTFWTKLGGTQPTNRHFLGEVIQAAAGGNAAVIALDFQLKSPTDQWGDSPERGADNAYLERAIHQATSRHIPVVLTTGLIPLQGQSKAGFGFEKQWRREPNIFDDRALVCPSSIWKPDSCANPSLRRGPKAEDDSRQPGNSEIGRDAGVSVGFINLPTDKRMIPLSWNVQEFDQNQEKSNLELSSFALQIVNAYEDADNITPRTETNPRIQAAINQDQFVYAGFLKPGAFERPDESAPGEGDSTVSLSAQNVIQNEQTRYLLNHRIVIIGATWHVFGSGRGPAVDAYPTPVGLIPGVYLHANYVESLLDQRFAGPLPVYAALLVDLGFGYLLLVVMHWAEGNAWRLIVMFACVLIPVLAAYILMVNLGRYLDFVIPMLLLFLHIPIDRLEKIREHRGSKEPCEDAH